MGAIASQITSRTIVYSTVSDADQRKHQSSASLAFVPETDEFPAQMASYAENVSIWWRHHEEVLLTRWLHSLCVPYKWLHNCVCSVCSVNSMDLLMLKAICHRTQFTFFERQYKSITCLIKVNYFRSRFNLSDWFSRLNSITKTEMPHTAHTHRLTTSERINCGTKYAICSADIIRCAIGIYLCRK